MTWTRKDEAREWVWTTLRDEGAARFPYPVEGRIPNFEGADEAAKQLLTRLPTDELEHVKVNPDSPQKHLRRRLLSRGVTLYVPTPRLEGGFMRFDPETIPDEHYEDASMLSRWETWAESIDLESLPQLDLVVTGSVAVTRTGARCGKGEGFSDLELGILGELGHEAVPIATTVHPIQVVESLPQEEHDLRLSWIATPDEAIEIETPPIALEGIDWSRLDDEDLEEMPVLKRLRPT